MENRIIQITPTIIGVIVDDENDFYDLWNGVLCCNKRLTSITDIKKIHGTSTLHELEFDFEPIMGKEELKALIQKAIQDEGLLIVNPYDIKGQTFSNEHQNKWQESESKVIRGKLLIIEKI